MKVRLIKLSHNTNALRTNEVVGECTHLPAAGRCFMLTGKPLTPGMDTRLVTTSPVKDVETIDSNQLKFRTWNSTYHLELLEDTLCSVSSTATASSES